MEDRYQIASESPTTRKEPVKHLQFVNPTGLAGKAEML